MVTAANDRTRGERYGWIFAAVWLFYLLDTVSALLSGPSMTWRVIGLVAVVLFGVTYLVVVKMSSVMRRSPLNLPRDYVVRSSIGILVMLGLFGLMVPGAGSHALTCLVYIAAFSMVSLPLPRAIAFAALLAASSSALDSSERAIVPGWTDNGYGLAVVLGSLATWGIRLATERQSRLLAAQKEIADLAVQNERARIAARHSFIIRGAQPCELLVIALLCFLQQAQSVLNHVVG